MKQLILISSLMISLIALFTSCRGDGENVQVTGFLSEQGITTYQYGTHVITTTAEVFALRSSDVNLDDYVGMTVTVRGNEIDGYPVDGGPIYIEVFEVSQ